MFNIKNITYDPLTQQYRCTCQCGTAMEAKEIAVGFLPSVKMRFGFTTELISQGNTVILAGPDQETIETAATLLNNSIYR